MPKEEKITVILATHNTNKVREYREMLHDRPIDLRLPDEAEGKVLAAVEENGKTYAENALLKARAIHDLVGGYVMADDSGLSLDVLDGYPGIYSARFAGEDTSYPDKIQQLWKLLAKYPESDWTAAFHAAIAWIDPEGGEYTFTGRCDGKVIHEMRGKNGFGYDPVFFMEQYGMTTAEMDPDFKNSISHRGKAVEQWLKFIDEHHA